MFSAEFMEPFNYMNISSITSHRKLSSNCIIMCTCQREVEAAFKKISGK